MAKVVVGVMGPGEQATMAEQDCAYGLGQVIAAQGWVLLTGGRAAGVMDAACRGAQAGGGLTVGVVPRSDRHGLSPAVDIAIVTGMGHGRNAINVLSSDLVIACGMGLGTASEVALALKAQKPVILLQVDACSQAFFRNLAPTVAIAATPEEAIAAACRLLSPTG